MFSNEILARLVCSWQLLLREQDNRRSTRSPPRRGCPKPGVLDQRGTLSPLGRAPSLRITPGYQSQ